MHLGLFSFRVCILEQVDHHLPDVRVGEMPPQITPRNLRMTLGRTHMEDSRGRESVSRNFPSLSPEQFARRNSESAHSLLKSCTSQERFPQTTREESRSSHHAQANFIVNHRRFSQESIHHSQTSCDLAKITCAVSCPGFYKDSTHF